ncbi:hypothetical protein BI004_gp172 [Bacillus phage NotTheCreek]|uniref:SsDNA binding protein n=2 Tax=Wphvirus TaxID=1922327 RepID=A0A222Z257_9CAUD|nr:hypothetical protein SAGEFAYGE_173 [Bacillus phage SageFayge]YP_009284500.1 hypothetical protein BI004_gp172 [Bacillus phage NotTheCreek]ASR78243.1 hypothetical protein PPISBEST_174 [Bacillus phage PPIsBest]QDH49447.1 hypothetical protein PHIREBALL_173 [Bacillus phage Phireball]QDH50155.1 hypothetical protein ALPS_169 [Bacillus phage ALPS]ULF49081.1 hypothetical protein [Bacillus phage Darren]AMW63093.1 hypothetical protein SAGEFAYGE_173 [Bacillus phage SageFayge]
MNIPVDFLDFDEITIKDTNGLVESFDLREELKINPVNLQEEMLEQPVKYVYWSALHEKVRYLLERQELRLEQIVANLDAEARSHIKSQGEKPTKDSVEAYIKTRTEYDQQRKRVIEFEQILGRTSRIVKAFEQRSNMLQSIGKQLANEGQYGHKAGSVFTHGN